MLFVLSEPAATLNALKFNVLRLKAGRSKAQHLLVNHVLNKLAIVIVIAILTKSASRHLWHATFH